MCTYGYHQFEPAEVKRVAQGLGVDAASFVMVEEGATVHDRPGGRATGTLTAGRLYAMDYDTDAPSEWMAIHRPEGGIGFIAVGEEGLAKPYAAGVCFSKSGGRWRLVGQASTGL